MLYEAAIRTPLFLWSQNDAEKAHRLIIDMGIELSARAHLIPRFYCTTPYRPEKGANLCGIRLPHRIGMAAGFDKNGEALLLLQALGFAFVEIGTVLPRLQDGKPKPRIFRLPSERAIINRMGFNSYGAPVVNQILSKVWKHVRIPVGISLGKMAGTPHEEAAQDYIDVLLEISDYGSYLVINVSSPNTPGLRQLQDKRYLEDLVRAVVKAELKLAIAKGRWPRPVFVKLSPDLTDGECVDACDAAGAGGAQGLILTNTTTARPLRDPYSSFAKQEGGLSGDPLYPLTLEKLRFVRPRTKLPIIAVGGIGSGGRAYQMLHEGAEAVQAYSGFVFQGPRLLKEMREACALF